MDLAKAALLRKGEACHVVRDYIHHFANPVRLRILCELSLGEKTVTELVEAASVRQSTVSQQLNLLRLAGVVDRTRAGSHRLYRIADPLARETMEFFVTLAGKLLERQEPAPSSNGEDCVLG